MTACFLKTGTSFHLEELQLSHVTLILPSPCFTVEKSYDYSNSLNTKKIQIGLLGKWEQGKIQAISHLDTF